MIRFDSVSFRYPGAGRPVLSGIDLTVAEGELCLVVGSTGSGKSTLLRAVNGLVPHFTGGVLGGRVTVAGRDTRDHPPRELADVVGYVGQNPAAGFVTDLVEDELAYGMESLGLAEDVMRRRVEETLDLLGIADIRGRPLGSLSAGQQQRVAVGSVLTMHPSVLVLDEPTSALDPVAAEEVLSSLHRLVHDLGVTVLLAEHRLERVVQFADSVVRLPGGGEPVTAGTPGPVLADSPVAPPLVRLGQLAGWSPLPLTVRDARRAAGALRERLDRIDRAGSSPNRPRNGAGGDAGGGSGAPLARVRDLIVRYGRTTALRGVGLEVAPGEIVALMGRNGAGKSSLLAGLAGAVRPGAGTVEVAGREPTELKPRTLLRHVGLVPSEPGDLLYAETVAAECRQADRDAAAQPGSCQALLARIAPEVAGDTHPRDLSEGQRLSLALSVILTARPPLVLLDEPTRGLDYDAKTRLTAVLAELAGDGHAVIVATHDVELVAEAASRTVVVAGGEVVTDGPAGDVAVASPSLAPQVAKVLTPLPLLTVADVERALQGAQ